MDIGNLIKWLNGKKKTIRFIFETALSIALANIPITEYYGSFYNYGFREFFLLWLLSFVLFTILQIEKKSKKLS